MNKMNIITLTNQGFVSQLLSAFTSDEERLFINSFTTFLQVANRDKDFVIDLDILWKWLGYTKKCNAKSALTRHFEDGVHYIVQNDNTSARGGNNHERIMMTVNAMKEFCIKSNTPQAEKVRKYYLKLEEVAHEYCLKELAAMNLRYKQLEESATERQMKERHNALLVAHNCVRVVYIVLVVSHKGKGFLIKIGSTSDLRSRVAAMQKQYGIVAVLLDVFAVENNNQFEKYLHNNQNIHPYKYALQYNNQTSHEFFLLSDKAHYDSIKRIAEREAIKYKGKSVEELAEHRKILECEAQIKLAEAQVKVEQLKILRARATSRCLMHRGEVLDKYVKLLKLYKQYGRNSSDLKELLTILSRCSRMKKVVTVQNRSNGACNDTIIPQANVSAASIELVEPESCLLPESNELITADTKDNTNKEIKISGPRVQIYKPDNLNEVYKVFAGIKDAVRNVPGTSFTPIKRNAHSKGVYKGYRWHFIEADDPEPMRPRDIGPTKDGMHQIHDYIAMVDSNKSHVVKVFLTQEAAAMHLNKFSSEVYNAVNHGRLLKDHYWVRWETLPEEIKTAYLAINELPEKVHHRGKPIEEYDPSTGNLIASYPSLTKLCLVKKVSEKTIKAVLGKNIPYQGSCFRSAIATNTENATTHVLPVMTLQDNTSINIQQSLEPKVDILSFNTLESTKCDEYVVAPSECDESESTGGSVETGTRPSKSKFQMYSEDGTTLIKTFQSFKEVHVALGAHRTHLMKVIKENQVYKGYRWATIPLDAPDDTKQTLEPSVYPSETHARGYVAQLNQAQDTIVKVYTDQKEAAQDNNTCKATISSAITHSSCVGQQYFFKRWDQCDPELQAAYLANNALPDARVIGKSILQIDKDSKQVIKTYGSITDLLKKTNISRKKLRKALDTGQVLEGYIWKFESD